MDSSSCYLFYQKKTNRWSFKIKKIHFLCSQNTGFTPFSFPGSHLEMKEEGESASGERTALSLMKKPSTF
jgi:hypothetical protein